MRYVILFIAIMLACAAYAGDDKHDILTHEERLWLVKNQSRIVLAVETNYAPFVFIDSKGQPTGLANDYILLIESKLGAKFLRKSFASLSDIFEKVKSREIHIVNAVTKTPERLQFMNMTDPFISVPNVIITQKEHSGGMSEQDLSGLRVSMVKNYAVTEYLTNKNLGFTPDLSSDDLTALLNVSFGRSNAAVIDLATASYLITSNGITNLRVAGITTYEIKLSVGAALDEPMLFGIIQKALKAITDEERQSIKDRWINTSGESILSSRHFWMAVIGLITLILTIFTSILIWNRMLSRQVSIRTAALAEESKKRIEQEKLLMQQSKMAAMGQMIGVIAHQWKQPVSVISAVMQEMEDAYSFGELDEKGMHTSVKQVMEQLEYMTRTIEVFRNFLKPSREKVIFHACEATIDILHLLEPQLKKHSIRIKINEYEQFNVNGYPNEFKQAVMNIIVNAKDAIEERCIKEGEIEFIFEHDEQKGTIRIRDNAGGIPQELLPNKLFESYITTKGEKGTGIGLNICKVIIEEKMGGKLTVRNVDGGAEFVIELPLAKI